MIKFIVAALWISAVTVATLMYSFNSATETTAVEAPPPLLGGLDYIKTEIVSVPVLAKGGISGYFLARLVYTIEPDKAKKLSVPANTLIGDELYSYLFSNPNVDFARVDTLDVDKFRGEIRDRLNTRLGDTIIHDVLVEQIDFLSKEEIRDNTIRRKQAASDVRAKMEAVSSGGGTDSGHGTPAAH
ncbi:MAG: hypothetical protein KF723_19335 [Rhizobiaceae bacterium]|nr:hypothetical protein [Rhizobiaceae bacterium]